LGLCAALAILVPVAEICLIQSVNASQDQCSAEGKAALYESFLKNRQTDQAKAYDDAKKYLACPATDLTEAQQKIVDYLKKWSTAYDEGSRKNRVTQLIYNEQKYADAYQLANEVLAKEPDNLTLLVHLGANGYLVAPLKNAALSAQALDYARRALQQLESGKNVENWEPLAGREVAIAYLNFSVGALSLEKEPGSAVKYLINASQPETPLKKSPYTYAYIAGAYETGEYTKQAEEYKQNYAGKDETPESKVALANINDVIDRMIDAYARAVALAGNNAAFASAKSSWNESLTTWYKFRHNNSDAGLTELIANVLSTPLPPLPTKRTSL
jgi:hypothetical protein